MRKFTLDAEPSVTFVSVATGAAKMPYFALDAH
jgi:hypothetical protein